VAPQYLLLLAISQTCRFQGKSFLKFLLSKEQDVDAFRRARPIRYSAPVARRELEEPVPAAERSREGEAPGQTEGGKTSVPDGGPG
jgi:hypothetical protein